MIYSVWILETFAALVMLLHVCMNAVKKLTRALVRLETTVLLQEMLRHGHEGQTCPTCVERKGEPCRIPPVECMRRWRERKSIKASEIPMVDDLKYAKFFMG